MQSPYTADADRILQKYPEAKLAEKTTPGYGYDFGKFRIYKNITGTGGWILVYDTPKGEPFMHSFALNFDEAVNVGREKTNG